MLILDGITGDVIQIKGIAKLVWRAWVCQSA